MIRILITGSRIWTNADMMQAALTDAIETRPGAVTIVHGGARGADELAAVLAPLLGPHVACERWPADWNAPCGPACQPGHRRTRFTSGGDYCPAAGAYRNQAMVDTGADLCLAFPLNESPGTRDCMRRAEAAGIPVIDVPATVCSPLYSTEARAKRAAWLIADRTSTKPAPPIHHKTCGGWHVAGTTDTDTKTGD